MQNNLNNKISISLSTLSHLQNLNPIVVSSSNIGVQQQQIRVVTSSNCRNLVFNSNSSNNRNVLLSSSAAAGGGGGRLTTTTTTSTIRSLELDDDDDTQPTPAKLTMQQAQKFGLLSSPSKIIPASPTKVSAACLQMLNYSNNYNILN